MEFNFKLRLLGFYHFPNQDMKPETIYVEEANSFVPPEWFDEDVTDDRRYHNSYLSKLEKFDINDFK